MIVVFVALLLAWSVQAIESPVNEKGEHHMVIVSCSFNNQQFYRWNLDSVINQQYNNWHLIYVDDDSPDGTGNLVQEYISEHGIEDKVLFIRNVDRVKAMANLYRAIHQCNPTDVIVILDGDDRFAQDKALQRVNKAYSNSDIWLTYGQFRVYGGFPFYCHPYPQRVINDGSFRSYLNTPSHLRTFYAGLFHKIHKEDMMKNGTFFEMTYDLAMMFPMIEMARTHFTFIPDVLVDYNNANPINDHKVNKSLQRGIDQEIRHKPRYHEIASPF